jgi:hypothetical protein
LREARTRRKYQAFKVGNFFRLHSVIPTNLNDLIGHRLKQVYKVVRERIVIIDNEDRFHVSKAKIFRKAW